MNLNFILLQKNFISEDYSSFSDILDAFINVERLIQDNKDRLYSSDSFYDNFDLYNAIWQGHHATRQVIQYIGKREYDYLQKFFAKILIPSNINSFQDFSLHDTNLNRAALGWYKHNLSPNKFVSTVQDWYNVHHNYFQQNPTDISYFVYSESKHLIIENTLLDEKKVYLKDTAKRYIDINDRETNPKPNINPNWGKGFFMVGDDYYFIFPNLDYSNTLKPWHLIYENKEKSDFPKDIYKKAFRKLDKKDIATNDAEVIANANFYVMSDGLSKLNDKKNSNAKKTPYCIYSRGVGRYQTFLSIDFEKCTFEVFNFQGKHIGEYRLDGVRNDIADQEGKHDILVQ